MAKHTAEEAVEYLNDAADYAQLILSFWSEPCDDPEWCLLKWGKGSEARVHIDTLYGYGQDIPDRAKAKDFAAVISRAKEGL
jgi:hypothetical protein